MGGVPKLLDSLATSFHFTAIEESQLDRDLPVWIVQGEWQRARLAGWLPDQKDAILAGKPADLRQLSPQVPDRVAIFIGRDDFFPYRIEYWRSSGKSGAGEGARASADADGTANARLVTVLELFEVQFDGVIENRQFDYNPGDLQPKDQTGPFLSNLGISEDGEAQP